MMKGFNDLMLDVALNVAASVYDRPDIAPQWAKCESPIEERFLRGLLDRPGCKSILGTYSLDRRAEMASMVDGPTAFVFAQHSLGRYRVDFLVVVIDPTTRTSRTFAIECDGKGFHDPIRDHDRDADLLYRGLNRIIRISGSKIYADLNDVLDRIVETMGLR